MGFTNILPRSWAVILLTTIVTSDAGGQLEIESVLLRLVDQVDVPAKVAGVLAELHVVRGHSVQEGSLLATIDDTEARLLVQRAETEFELARRKAELDVAIRLAQRNELFAVSEYRRVRQAQAARRGSVSESELEEKLLQRDQAKLNVERSQRELELAKITARSKEDELRLAQHDAVRRRIVAPIHGTVVEVHHEAGEWVEAGDMVFRIVRTDRLHAEGFLEASDLRDGLIGATVSLTVDLRDGAASRFAGRLVFISPEIDPVNHQVRVCAEIDNREGRLRPGLRARMMIDAN